MTPQPPARPGHPYHMYDAIYAQPGALRLIGRGKADGLAAAAKTLRERDRVLVTGLGTSWHAALLGELLFAHVGGTGHRARALNAFELAHTWPAPDARAGVVVLSHRGTAPAVQAALGRARDGGAASVTVCGKGGSPGAADHVLETVEQEASGTHTVSYTSALALLALLAAAVGGDDGTPGAVDGLADHLALLLGQESWEELAARFADHRRYVFVGGGPNTATAYEAALKVSETCQLLASGFHCEEFLHGPWAALEASDLLALVALPGPSYDRCLDVARLAKEIGATVLAVVQEGDRALAGIASETIELASVDELLSPILAVVPFQLLAYHWALLRGTNPDRPRANHHPWDRARTAIR